MADLNAHKAGNGGQSQRMPKALSGLFCSATADAGADPPNTRGRPKPRRSTSDQPPRSLPGVVVTACRQRRPSETREAPAVIAARDQLAPRESQAGPVWGDGRPVVPMKSGNADGGKRPQLRANARSNEDGGIGVRTPNCRTRTKRGQAGARAMNNFKHRLTRLRMRLEWLKPTGASTVRCALVHRDSSVAGRVTFTARGADGEAP